MKKFLLACWVAVLSGVLMPAMAKVEHVLPIPQKVTMQSGLLTVPRGTGVTVAGIAENATLRRFLTEAGLGEVTFDAQATAGLVEVEMVKAIEGAYDYPLAGYANEAYVLEVTDKIRIKAIDPIGVTRAAQTLTQMAEGYDSKDCNLEHVTITDWPAFKLRGFMHDIGRSYMSVAMIKRHIDRLARFKVNTFHWHLTENQGFRFEVKNAQYSKINNQENMTRHAGKYYTQAECRDMVQYAAERGVTVIPEIDMPGHSEAFTKAFGYSMQSDEGKVALKAILDEVVDVFADVPYIHIGADEEQTTKEYVNEMVAYVQGKGKKCVIWNPMRGVAAADVKADMCQLWSTAGTAVEGKANIDCRYNYTNHFDVFADLVGIYKSNIYYRERGDKTVAGTISAHWNDRRLENEDEIVSQNNFYASVIASASRAWQGGGKQYIDKSARGGRIGGGVMLPNSGEELEDFREWETRFLFHKAHCLKDEPIPYVKQTNVRWRISDAFDNGGDVTKVFPPEEVMNEAALQPDTYTYEGQSYGSGIATGAGIYLRHTWGPGTIAAYYENPAYNQTAYAWTYVYSPKQQKVGALIELQNYSRSELDPAPQKGEWDLMGSKIWINGEPVAAPAYKNTGVAIPDKEVTQKDENFPARKPVQVTLKQGWNKVFLKLPYVNAAYRLDKWMFTCVFTDVQGKAAVDGLIYSPNQYKDEATETVAAKVTDLKAHRDAKVKNQPGYYAAEVAAKLNATLKTVEATLHEERTAEERQAQLADLDAALNEFDEACKQAKVLMPEVSTPDRAVYYTLSTPRREGRMAVAKGADAPVMGEQKESHGAYWRFVRRTDGTLNIVNYNNNLYISPASGNNTALKTQTAMPTQGWTLSAANTFGTFIITSGTVQFNQTNGGNGYKVFNWGSGNNRTDDGCVYEIKAVDPKELEVDPAMPVVGQHYYLYNKHRKGDQHFYDNNGTVGFSAQRMDKQKAYVWVCEDGGNGTFFFRNLKTERYFAWQSLSTTACAWKLDAKTGVNNPGCVSMQAVGRSGSNFLVCKQGMFDQAQHADYYDDTFSSDFKLDLCTNTEWEDAPAPKEDFYSRFFGENWVRMLWNNGLDDAAGLTASTAEGYANRPGHSVGVNLTSMEQLWCLMGNEQEGFLLMNAAAGADLALHVAGTGNGAEAKLVDKSKACKWRLVKKGEGVYAVTPWSNQGMSLNSYGGKKCPLKLYSADDPGSKWQLRVVVEGLKMVTVVNGENPFEANNRWAGELNFVLDGTRLPMLIEATGTGERTYYLPQGSKGYVEQTRALRGYSKGGLKLDGKPVDRVDFTVGEPMKVVENVYEVNLTNGQYLYHTPGANGKPYRIPAIAQAKNGDIFAISDFRPCGMDIGYGEVDIKCRISKDNGLTWGDEFFVADGLGDNNGGQVWKTGFGDAAFVADADRNELLVMMVCGKTVCWNGNYIPNSPKSNPNRVARVRAKLNESTGQWEWTKPEEVTEGIYRLFVDANGKPTVQSLFIGSGRICQSRVTKVGDYYRLYCSVWTKNEGNRVIYSDDFGENWRLLGKVSDRPARGGDEPKCEELPNGSVVLSSRTNGRIFNIYTYSDVLTGAGSWGSEVKSHAGNNGVDVGNSTNGEILLVKAIRKSDNKKVDLALQSVPFAGTRANVGFFFKEITPSHYRNVGALAANWKKGLQVSDLGSAYSTMVLLADHRIGFLFEENPGAGDYSIVYIPLTLEEITGEKYAIDVEAYTTGVDFVVNDEQVVDGVYDLGGRQLEAPVKGVNIVNGRKVLVK